VLTATEMSEKFDVSIRTIYRDIRKLEEAGIPVITIEGRGYTLMDGYTVAPVQFTEKEANALITAHHLVRQSKDHSFVTDFEDAITKIKSVFRTSILEKSEILDEKIAVINIQQEHIASNALSEIQLAIIGQNFMEIDYQKPTDVAPLFRKIEPYAMYSVNNKWILVSWCYLRDDYRAFRIDRIRHFKILSDQFEDRGFNLQMYFAMDTYDGHKS
jgi:predicted DNA-binding transcriptional regulator YafY